MTQVLARRTSTTKRLLSSTGGFEDEFGGTNDILLCLSAEQGLEDIADGVAHDNRMFS